MQLLMRMLQTCTGADHMVPFKHAQLTSNRVKGAAVAAHNICKNRRDSLSQKQPGTHFSQDALSMMRISMRTKAVSRIGGHGNMTLASFQQRMLDD